MGNKFAAAAVLGAMGLVAAVFALEVSGARRGGRADEQAPEKPAETPAQATKRYWDGLDHALRPCRFDVVPENALRPDARPKDLGETVRRVVVAQMAAEAAPQPLYRAAEALEGLTTLDVDPEAAEVGKLVRFLVQHYAWFAFRAAYQVSELQGFYKANAGLTVPFDDCDVPPKVRDKFEQLGQFHDLLDDRLKTWRDDRAKLIKDVQAVRKALAEKYQAEFQDLTWLRGDAQ